MDESTIKLLSKYPFDITELDLPYCDIDGILDLNGYDKLTYLDCSKNKITQIINIPDSLTELICHSTLLTSLDNLPKLQAILLALATSNSAIRFLASWPERIMSYGAFRFGSRPYNLGDSCSAPISNRFAAFITGKNLLCAPE